jgi:hypothetical protein
MKKDMANWHKKKKPSTKKHFAPIKNASSTFT